MSTPILATKLYIPPPRPKAVLRPRLIERLNDGLHHKLTLISAPAGFGKTTLLSSWNYDLRLASDDLQAEAASQEKIVNRVAWLSLDEGDNDPARFLSHFISALQTLAVDIGEGALDALQSPQPPSIESILTSLLNQVASSSNNFILILDDYHVIDSKQIDNALGFLLKYLPPQLHLVIATREDPQLPLARLRARDQLTELRVADLRFTLSEATDFLNQVMGLSLSPEDIAVLEARTEGWIAGLQLAALALQGTISRQSHKDTTDFIKSFTGSHHFVMDYLVEEVLQQQSESIRNFLLCTSILDRLCGSLCDAVCAVRTASSSKGTAVLAKSSTSGQETAGQKTLEYLEQANLLIVPLDDKREWYRYHHLFADVLHARLMKEQPNQVAGLHRRACAWWEQNNFRADAIRHALAAKDFEQAAALIELAWPGVYRSYEDATWLGWVKALPDELVRARPVLSVGYAWTSLVGGELEAGEARLRDAERWLDTAAEPIADRSGRPEAPSAETCPAKSPTKGSGERSRRMVVVDEEAFRSLPATIASARAFHAQATGDVPGTKKYAQQALDLLPEDNYFERAIPAGLLGLAYWVSGNLEAAYRSIADGMANLRKAGNLLLAISGASVLADIRTAQGRLHEAVRTYQQSLQLVTGQGEPAPAVQGTADLYLGLSELYLEQGDLEAARQHLLTSEALGGQAAQEEVYRYRSRLTKARIKESQGDLDGALELLDDAERLYLGGVLPNLRPIAALKARVWLAQGRLAEALGWARERGLSVEDDLSYLQEFEHITLARLLIAQHRSDREERPPS